MRYFSGMAWSKLGPLPETTNFESCVEKGFGAVNRTDDYLRYHSACGV